MVVRTRFEAMDRRHEERSDERVERTSYILWPTDQADRRQMGGKGAALAALNGLATIPAWFVVTPAAFAASVSDQEQETLMEGGSVSSLQLAPVVATAVMAAMAQLDSAPMARFAVRSSATAEDGTTASFAGQLTSFLNVSRQEVLERIAAVWQSAFAEHVVAYRQQTGELRHDHETMAWAPAVLVQRMVDADVAGVAFSADPVTGDRSCCTITAVRGLADQLVSGQVNGESYQTDRNGVILAQHGVATMALLDPHTLRAIVAVVRAVEAHCGLPQDIEWALEDGQLFLLQARPITTLEAQESGKEQKKMGATTPISTAGVIWDNSNIVESYSGVTSPLTFSFARHVYEHVYIAFCRLMGVAPARITEETDAFRNLLGYVNGHVYYNLINWYRILALFPGFQMNRRFMEQMMGVKEPLADEVLDAIAPAETSRWARVAETVRLARAGAGLVWGEVTMGRTMKHFYRRLNDALTLTPDDMACLSLKQLVVEYRKVESQLLNRWDAPLVNDFLCMIAFGLSRRLLEQQAGAEGLALHSALLIGQGDIISAEPAQRIRAMAQLAAADEDLVALLCDGSIDEARYRIEQMTDLSTAYEAYLTKFGNRCLQELKLESPTLHDDPSTLIRAIGQMARRLQAGHAHGQPDQAEPASMHRLLAPLFKKQPLRRRLAGWTMKWAKKRVQARENLRFERTRVFGYARRLFLAMGQRLVEAGQLACERDIFLLTVDELLGTVDGTMTTYDLHGLVALRKSERARFNRLPAPPNRFTSSGLLLDNASPQAEYNRAEIAGEQAAERQGIGCSAGVVRAPVRVIKDPRGATLHPGEIMVAQFTDPGWITLFANAGGILVERGSLLSHSAIVARELGIPAIVAIDGVTTWLQSGDVVEMDGASGRVRRVGG